MTADMEPPENMRPWRSPFANPLQPEPSPYDYDEIEAWRSSWGKIERLRPKELHPAFNVAGLYWRPLRPLKSPLNGF